MQRFFSSRLILVWALSFWSFVLSGCGALTIPERNQVVGLVATAVGARSPTTELVQTYYLGVFDPQDQLPPALYRIRVRGQSSALSSVQFASGWVPAAVIDSLTRQVSISKTGSVTISKDDPADDPLSKLTVGRRLMMFGPEGFREAPADHRLAIVMGSSPDAFFDSVGQALGAVSQAKFGSPNKSLATGLSKFLLEIKYEAELYAAIGAD
jgi:hypothetical protein